MRRAVMWPTKFAWPLALRKPRGLAAPWAKKLLSWPWVAGLADPHACEAALPCASPRGGRICKSRNNCGLLLLVLTMAPTEIAPEIRRIACNNNRDEKESKQVQIPALSRVPRSSAASTRWKAYPCCMPSWLAALPCARRSARRFLLASGGMDSIWPRSSSTSSLVTSCVPITVP